MRSIQDDMGELRRQLEKGSIRKAYGALLSYMMALRTRFTQKYGMTAVSGLYPGYMDMTYFALFPRFLKDRNLKVAIVFNYGAFRFEAWLAARNRKVQREYWERFKESHWAAYRVIKPAKGIDAIIECDLAEDFDLGDPDGLTSRIENATAAFMGNIEKFLGSPEPGIR